MWPHATDMFIFMKEILMESFIFCAVYNCPYISDASPVSLKNTDQKIIGTLLCTCVALFEDSQSANIPYITKIVLIRKSFWLWNLKKILDLLLWEILVNPLSARAFIKSFESPQRANQLTGFYMRATLQHWHLMG